MSTTRKTAIIIIYSALFTALGLLFPQIFHIFGTAAGSAFLPMHIPVLIAGLCTGPICGLISGILSPFLSSVITMMPPPFKMPFMCIELAVYGVSAGLYKKLFSRFVKKELVCSYIALILAQLTGRVVNIICTYFAVKVLGVSHPAIGVATSVASIASGIPGIIIQLIFIPPIVKILSHLKVSRSWAA